MRQRTWSAYGLALALLLVTTSTSVSFAENPLDEPGLEERDRGGRVPVVQPAPHSSAEPGDDDMPNKEGMGSTQVGSGAQVIGDRRAGVAWFQERWQGMLVRLSQLLKALR